VYRAEASLVRIECARLIDHYSSTRTKGVELLEGSFSWVLRLTERALRGELYL